MLGENVVFVTGMGRSGTSVFSEWLSKCGVDFGSDISRIGHINPVGNFEDKAIRDVHFSIHKANGQRSWLDVPIDFEWDVSAQHRSEMGRIAEEIASRGSLVGIKDPLSTSFLSIWRELLPGARFVLVYRDPAQVVDSVVRMERRIQSHRRNRVAGLARRIQYSMSPAATLRDQRRALITWIRSNTEAVTFLSDLRPDQGLALSGDSWMRGEGDVFYQLVNDLGLKLENVPRSAVIREGFFNSTPPTLPNFAELAPRSEMTQELLAACSKKVDDT